MPVLLIYVNDLSAFSRQPSAVSRQLSDFSRQLSAVSFQPSAFSRQLSAVSFQPSAFSRQLSAVSLSLIHKYFLTNHYLFAEEIGSYLSISKSFTISTASIKEASFNQPSQRALTPTLPVLLLSYQPPNLAIA